jgi:hypothetical protein
MRTTAGSGHDVEKYQLRMIPQFAASVKRFVFDLRWLGFG